MNISNTFDSNYSAPAPTSSNSAGSPSLEMQPDISPLSNVNPFHRIQELEHQLQQQKHINCHLQENLTATSAVMLKIQAEVKKLIDRNQALETFHQEILGTAINSAPNLGTCDFTKESVQAMMLRADNKRLRAENSRLLTLEQVSQPDPPEIERLKQQKALESLQNHCTSIIADNVDKQFLRNTISDLMKTITELEKALETKEEALASLQAELQEMKENAENPKLRSATSRRRNQKTQEKLSILSAENYRRQLEKSFLEKEFSTSQGLISSLQTRLSEAESEAVRLRTIILNLQREIDQRRDSQFSPHPS